MTDLLQRIENSIQSRKLISRGEKMLVAVSGGLDSMVLLHALKNLSAKYKWQIVVAHFNHQLRGRASDADEKLVRRTAAKLKLSIAVESADVKELAKRSKLSIEMAARKLRHEFFARTARTRKIKTIALAHHADDQVELFFLRLLRGTGGEGLSGMRWKSPSPADKTISIVRPFLNLAKVEMREFARENKTQFRHDATNFSLGFLRNRIRNELLPLLRKNYQCGLDKIILRLMEIVSAESEFVGQAARLAEKDEFEKLPIAIQRRVLQSQLTKLNLLPDFELIESLRQFPNQFVSVGSQISVVRNEFGEVQLREELKSEFRVGELVVNLSGRAGETVFDGMKFRWKFASVPRGRSPHGEFFNADKIGGKIILRHWRVGDRFQPIGLKSPVKLQDLFVNAKIPREQRRNLIVAAAESGEIFWVEGLRISENFKITPQTKRQLIWRWQNRR